MTKKAQQQRTDPNENPLDGTKGGALDQSNGAPPMAKVFQLDEAHKAHAVKQIRDVVEWLNDRLRADREKLTTDKKAKLAGLESDYGINPHAFAAALARSRLNEKKQANFDNSYKLCLEALGVETQRDMFDEDDD